MPSYRCDCSGTSWFFTVVTHSRRPLLVDASARDALRSAISDCRHRFPFRIEAWVLLPDHVHAVWTLPDSDRDYSRRWSVIKRRFTQRMIALDAIREGNGDLSSIVPAWQQRFWAHRINDETDYEHHLSYVHINPLKHGLVERVVDWPWSSFHRFVAMHAYPVDWGGTVRIPESVGRE